MTTRSSRLGRDGEIPFLAYCRAELGPAEGLRKAGRNDEGDVAVTVDGITYVVEVKNVERMEIPNFVRQSEVEVINYANKRGYPKDRVRPLVVMKKRGTRDVGEWFALTTVKNFPW